jgi:hypothetical protein
MIDFSQPTDLQFACEHIESTLLERRQGSTPNEVLTVTDLNKMLIAEGLFNATPIMGVSLYEWSESRALISLITTVKNHGKLEDWLPSFDLNPRGINASDTFSANQSSRPSFIPDFTQRHEEPSRGERRANISPGAQKAVLLKKVKRLTNKFFYDRSPESLQLFEEVMREFEDFICSLPVDFESHETYTPTNEELLNLLEQSIEKWPLKKVQNLPANVIEKRKEFKRFVEPWSAEEIELLGYAAEVTQNSRRLSEIFQRSTASLEYKLEELGL